MGNSKAFKFILSAKSVGAILLGLVFLVLGIYFLINPHEYEYTATATISDIQVTGGEWVTEGDTNRYEENHTVYVDYSFSGKEIKGAELGSYSSSMKVGDSIEIQFDSDDLTHVSETGFDLFPVVAIVLGGISVAVGIIEMIKLPRARARR